MEGFFKKPTNPLEPNTKVTKIMEAVVTATKKK